MTIYTFIGAILLVHGGIAVGVFIDATQFVQGGIFQELKSTRLYRYKSNFS